MINSKAFVNNDNTECRESRYGMASPVISQRRHFLRQDHIPQYVHDSVSNVSHLPAVNYRIERRIKKYKSAGEKKNLLSRNAWAADLVYRHTNTERQITNPKIRETCRIYQMQI